MKTVFLKNLFKKNPKISLPYILIRKHIYILPTRYGLFFLIVLFAMLLGSINYNNNLGFLLTFLLGGMAFVSTIHTVKNLFGIRLLSAGAKPVFAGDQAVFEFHVRAENYTHLAVSFRFEYGGEKFLDLSDDADYQVSIAIPVGKRGKFHPGALVISSVYPFGLFYSWAKLTLDMDCLVYPRPFDGSFLPAAERDSDGENGRKSIQGVDDFQGLKFYQPGDSLQHISWKTFSRGQGLFTKSFTGKAGTTIVLDWNMVKTSETEKKLSILCDSVLKAHRLGLTYGLKIPGREIESLKGDAHKHKCLKALALFQVYNEPV